MKKQKKLVILGGGESGVGAAVLGKKMGMNVYLSDRGTLKDKYRDELFDHYISFEEGFHMVSRIMDADIVVKSPGIPDSANLVKELRAKGVPVVSELEFASYFTDAKMICITGSNGKTTTTSLIHHILVSSGINAGLAGNIGQSLARQVAEDPKPVYVVEISSFQLDGMFDFKADIALLMNITPDHLDRYDHKMQNYIDSKFRIIRNQTPDDYFIYWQNDPVIQTEIAKREIQAQPLPFSEKENSQAAAWVEGENLVFREKNGNIFRLPRKDVPLKGLHNMYNTMAATLATLAYGLSPKEIAEGIASFKAVEHRLELVAVKDGVRWINDSKATNVASTYYALESMDSPTVLILGGTDKGNDYSVILPFVKEKVKAIVCMGVDNKKLMDFFSGKVEKIYDTGSLEETISACREVAMPGDTVLLSPCCASFDLFKNYEDRGNRFKAAVNNF